MGYIYIFDPSQGNLVVVLARGLGGTQDAIINCSLQFRSGNCLGRNDELAAFLDLECDCQPTGYPTDDCILRHCKWRLHCESEFPGALDWRRSRESYSARRARSGENQRPEAGRHSTSAWAPSGSKAVAKTQLKNPIRRPEG